ncbi:MAG: NAD(P)/FAD-dependent oxidoreductase [Planctomycetaceae bacterium]
MREISNVRYDTVIIGAGLSGLAAGIRLAYFNKSVCMVEKHSTIGGLNSFYRLRNRNHDVGLHAVTNYAPPGTKSGPLSKLLRQLRLRWDDFSLCPQIESSIVFPGYTLRFNNDFSLLFQQIVEQFPKQVDNLRRLLRHIDSHDYVNLNHVATSARAVVGEFLTDSRLVDMLFCPLMYYGSATPRDMDFHQFVVMFKSIFYEGLGRPFEGIRLILKKLVRQFKSLGGELRLRAGVKSIQGDSSRATGVVLEDGEVVEASSILSSAGSAETLRLLPNGTDIPKSTPGEISFLETIFSLDRQPQDLGYRQTMVFYNDDETFHYEMPEQPADVRSGIICSPNNFKYKIPLEEGRIRITALANPGYWMNLPEDEYVAQKKVWCRRVVESSIRHMPDFRASIVDTDVFTPRTINRFTGHINGCVYGAPDKLVNGRTPLENVFVCGTDQGFVGIIGSILSGISIANTYLVR